MRQQHAAALAAQGRAGRIDVVLRCRRCASSRLIVVAHARVGIACMQVAAHFTQLPELLLFLVPMRKHFMPPVPYFLLRAGIRLVQHPKRSSLLHHTHVLLGHTRSMSEPGPPPPAAGCTPRPLAHLCRALSPTHPSTATTLSPTPPPTQPHSWAAAAGGARRRWRRSWCRRPANQLAWCSSSSAAVCCSPARCLSI